MTIKKNTDTTRKGKAGASPSFFCAGMRPKLGRDSAFYSPNISRVIRLAPLTSPVSTSMLNTISPMYSHTMVTAGREASAAGLPLERNAE